MIQVEEKKDLTHSSGEAGLIEIWTKEIENATREEKEWRDEAKKYFEIYKDEFNNNQQDVSGRYNIFWSNTQTLRPLTFSNLPDANITRRFLGDDDNARILSEMMERSLTYYLDKGDAENVYNKDRDDYLIGGRGIARVVLEEGEIVEIDGEEEVVGERDYKIEYVNWEDFRVSPEKTWEDVRWVAFLHKMTRSQLVEQFGAIGKDVSLDFSSVKDEEKLDDTDLLKHAQVWEIWDKESGLVYFITLGANGKILSKEEDPYELVQFFPVAKILGNDTNPCGLTPVPLYRMYRSQAEELNQLDFRIKNLIEQCKFTGVYATMSEKGDVNNFMNGQDGVFEPMQGVAPGVKVSDMIEYKPLQDIAITIGQLDQQRGRILQNIRDITGLSDIVRGSTIAGETATAQRLKGDFAISRLQPIQKEFEIFVRNTNRLLIELIVENSSAQELAKITGLLIVDIETIAKVTQEKLELMIQEGASNIKDLNSPEGIQQLEALKEQAKVGFKKTMAKPISDLKGYAVTPQQLEEIDFLMKNDKLRSFAVDIETDATVKVDQSEEKQERFEFVQAVSNFSGSFFPLVQAGIITPRAFNKFLGFVSKPFKVGRNLEELLLDEGEQEEEQGPSVEEQIAQADSQRADQEIQLKAQDQQIQADQGQQKINIEKAKVKQDQIQFEDQIDFEDVNKAADRRVTIEELVERATERAVKTIRESV